MKFILTLDALQSLLFLSAAASVSGLKTLERNFATSMETASDYGAFMEKFTLPPNSAPSLPLNSLTFAVKEMYVLFFLHHNILIVSKFSFADLKVS